jgi:hypothetical protein
MKAGNVIISQPAHVDIISLMNMQQRFLKHGVLNLLLVV